MKELLERLVTLVPAYFADLVQLTTGPKRFLVERSGSWNEGLIFLAISFLLTFVLQLPLARMDPLLEAAGDAVFVLTYVVLYGFAVVLAWRAVGGKAPAERFFAIHFYVAGVLKLIMSTAFMMVIGVLRVGDLSVYEEVNKAMYAGDALWFLTNVDRLITQPVWQAATTLALIGVLVMFVWIVTVWGAYRRLNGLSKARSGMALAIFCALCLPVYLVTSLIAAALIR